MNDNKIIDDIVNAILALKKPQQTEKPSVSLSSKGRGRKAYGPLKHSARSYNKQCAKVQQLKKKVFDLEQEIVSLKAQVGK